MIFNQDFKNIVIFTYRTIYQVVKDKENRNITNTYNPLLDFIEEFEANDPRLPYTVDLENNNVNKIFGTLDGSNKGNDDAESNRIYIRFRK